MGHCCRAENLSFNHTEECAHIVYTHILSTCQEVAALQTVLFIRTAYYSASEIALVHEKISTCFPKNTRGYSKKINK